jgi:integrase/recombinase XerD
VEQLVQNYIIEITINQNLSKHTIKAYQIDLKQTVKYFEEINITDVTQIKKEHINEYIAILKDKYKVKTIKRKLISIKKFFNYLQENEYILVNPFDKVHVKLKTDVTLPKTIDFHEMKKMYIKVYDNYNKLGSNEIYYLTEILIVELLYTTGVRVSELCNIKKSDLNFRNKTILIRGKGRKERIVFIQNTELIYLIKKYIRLTNVQTCEYLLRNKYLVQLSDQSTRFRLKRIAKESGVTTNITPHMFRHTFATSLLEEEVNLMYIQDLLGHSSLSTTQIYITINKKKQQKALFKKHPRKNILTPLYKG